MGIPAIAIAMITGGTALETYSTLQEGKESAKAGKYQQLMYERQAKAVEASGLHEQHLLREQGRQVKSRQIVNIAAGGGTLSGTSLKAIIKSAQNVEADAATIAQSAQFEAETLRYHGRVARYQGKAVRYASRIRAMTTIGKNMGSAMLMAGRGSRSAPSNTTTVQDRLRTIGVLGG